MELKDKKIAVIGLGKTGRAACRFFAAQGARVVATDEKPLSQLGEAQEDLRQAGTAVTLVAHDTGILEGTDLVVPSPAIPPYHEILKEAVRKGIPVLSELEIAGRFLKQPMIAITGTNGKTTTTTLTAHILTACGKKVFVGGNIGNPLLNYVAGPQDADYAVVEASSFQLLWTEKLRPFVAAILNVACDHIDYHGSRDAYREAKERISRNQTSADVAILNAADEGTPRLVGTLAARTLVFRSSGAAPGAAGLYVENDQLVYTPVNGAAERYPMEMIKLPGLHNVENVMAALAIARACGCAPAEVQAAIDSFKGLPHRIEFSGEVGGVAYYDDSKGTNVDAVRRALETFQGSVILLLGGRDKEGDFDTLAPEIRGKVRSLVIFGEARARIEKLVGGLVETSVVSTMREAVLTAHKKAVPGDVVLLSPGCASFDEFNGYKLRGEFFQQMVKDFRHV